MKKKLQRKIGLAVAPVLLGAAMSIVTTASPALAAGMSTTTASPGIAAKRSGGDEVGRLIITGSCGDTLRLRVHRTGEPIEITITIPSSDPSEVWDLTVTQQEYDAVTGGRIGDPIDITDTLPPLFFLPGEGGFTSEGGQIANTPGRTHGVSYTATRTSPAPLTCTNEGFWTNPGGGSEGPVAGNPATRPDTAPAPTGTVEADAGTNDALLQFDQEMLDTAQGIPDTGQFAVAVDGVSRTPTAVTVLDESPPSQAVVDVSFDGPALTSGQTVTVQYRRPLSSSQPALQDLENLRTASFGPISIPVF